MVRPLQSLSSLGDVSGRDRRRGGSADTGSPAEGSTSLEAFQQAVQNTREPDQIRQLLIQPGGLPHEAACRHVAREGKTFDRDLVGYLLAAEPGVARLLAENEHLPTEGARVLEDWALGMARGFWVDPGPAEQKVRMGLMVLTELHQRDKLQQVSATLQAFQKAREQQTPLPPKLENALENLTAQTEPDRGGPSR